MNLIVRSVQKYDSHEEEIIQKYEEATAVWEEGKLKICHAKGKMCFDNVNGEIMIENEGNTIRIKINEKKVLTYHTPYGTIKMETYGEKLQIQETTVKILLVYHIYLEDGTHYSNTIEMTEG